MTEYEHAADCDAAMVKMLEIDAARRGPSKGVRRRTDKLPADVRRNGTRWGYIKKEPIIGPAGWGR